MEVSPTSVWLQTSCTGLGMFGTGLTPLQGSHEAEVLGMIGGAGLDPLPVPSAMIMATRGIMSEG